MNERPDPPASSLAVRWPERLGFKATLGATVGWIVAYATGCDAVTCAASAGLMAVATRIALLDLRARIILDGDLVGMAAIGSAWLLWSAEGTGSWLILSAALQGLVYGALLQAVRMVYMRLRGRDGLGFGDVKLAAAGPLIEPGQFGRVVAVAALSALVFALWRALRRRPSRYTYVPFGTFLAPTVWAVWLSTG